MKRCFSFVQSYCVSEMIKLILEGVSFGKEPKTQEQMKLNLIAREGRNLIWFDIHTDTFENTFEAFQVLDSKQRYAGVLKLSEHVRMLHFQLELFNLNESTSTLTIGNKHFFICIMYVNERDRVNE